MPHEWTNWAGDVRFTPEVVERPRSEDEVVALVRRAIAEGKRIRAIGSGHSSNPLMASDEVFVNTEALAGLESVDADADADGGSATFRAGTKLKDANDALFKLGLMIENLGDVDVQALAGAVATGTHGSGRRFTNLSGMIVGGRLVDGRGEVVEFSEEKNPEVLKAARVSLGALGLFTSIRMKVVPSLELVRQEWCTHIEALLPHVERLDSENRNFDYYWYPRSDLAKFRTWNPVGEQPLSFPFAKLDAEQIAPAREVLGTKQTLHYHECEYSVPIASGPDCLRAVRDRVKAKHRKLVAWRILCRNVHADDGHLSNASGRDVTAITLHQNNTLPCWDYFKDIEPIYREFDGRPHWGKKHTMTAEQLRAIYPAWDRFQAVRAELDPRGVFLNPYVRRLLGPEPEPESTSAAGSRPRAGSESPSHAGGA